MELEKILRNAKLIDEAEIRHDIVALGSTVILKDLEDSSEEEYTIVGSTEANPKENKISNESPVGKALIGHKKGDTVEGSAQAGTFSYKILQIKRSN